MSKPKYPLIKTEPLDPRIEADLKRLGSKVAAVSPAGAKNVMREEGLRRWTPEGYRAAMTSLRSRGYSIVLVGGPGDEWARSALEGSYDLDLVGMLDLKGFITLLSKVTVLITHDSGPLHMGDLAGVPVVGLFGPTAPDEKIPIRSKYATIWGGGELPCRPCYDGRNYSPCSTNHCMAQIDPMEVVSAVETLVGRVEGDELVREPIDKP